MRNRKFRVFDKIKKVMVQVESIALSEGMFKPCDGGEYDFYPYDTEYYSELMEWTSMTDSKGDDIYEGDYATKGSIEFFEVVYQAPSFVMKKPLKKGLSKTWQSFIGHPSENQFITVVGNKYE